LWETTVSIAATKTTSTLTTTVASAAATVGRVLLLSGGVDAAWEQLVDGHAELLDVCQLAVYCGQAGGLALHLLGLGWGRSNKLIFN